MKLESAIIAKQTWKHPLLDAYCTALLTSALALHARGIIFFNNDDVPESHQPGDKTTVGVAFGTLCRAKIIEPWRGSVEKDRIWGGLRASSRACNNGHRNQLYTLTNLGIAREWLQRHGVSLAPVQCELALT